MKARILKEIHRTTLENGGKPLGVRKFELETGIKVNDWFGKYWRNWGDAVREAGFEANRLQGRLSDEHILEKFVGFTESLGRIPVKGDLLLKRSGDPTFPNEKVFSRFGGKAKLLARAEEFCAQHDSYRHLAAMFTTKTAPIASDEAPPKSHHLIGFVYLLKSGRHFKIGKTNSVGRREYELGIQLPEKSTVVHEIATDDPDGIEAYWHKRFARKRLNGEWFKLDANDVAAFRRRKFQ